MCSDLRKIAGSIPIASDDLCSRRILRAHIGFIDARNFYRLLHRIAAEGFAKLLVQQDLDKGRLAFLHLRVNSRVEHLCKLFYRGRLHG